MKDFRCKSIYLLICEALKKANLINSDRSRLPGPESRGGTSEGKTEGNLLGCWKFSAS